MKRKIKELPFVLVRVVNFIFSQQFLVFFFSSAIFLKAISAVIIYNILPVDLMPTALLGSAGYIDNTVIALGVLAFAIGQAGLQYYILHE